MFKQLKANRLFEHLFAETPWGGCLIATTLCGICAIQFGSSADALLAQLARELPPSPEPLPSFDSASIRSARKELAHGLTVISTALTNGTRPHGLRLDVRGTAFQRTVWSALSEIAPGSTLSYAELAARIGQPRAARAVANACAANRIAIAVPCHRVIQSDGALGGYRWGEPLKRVLLERERAMVGR